VISKKDRNMKLQTEIEKCVYKLKL